MVHRTPAHVVADTKVQHSAANQYNSNLKRAAAETDEHEDNDDLTVRRRITRACDQCNQLRSKCDGNQPCNHCIENDLSCAYKRVHKKRGRVPRRDQIQSDVLKSAEPQNNASTGREHNEQPQLNASTASPNTAALATDLQDRTQENVPYAVPAQNTIYNGYDALQNRVTDISDQTNNLSNGFIATDAPAYSVPNFDISGFEFPLGDDFSVGFMGRAPMVESPEWLSLTAPMFVGEHWTPPPRPPDAVRFPVLQPILPYLESIIPQTLACDLLEEYFAATPLADNQPKNPFVLSYIFRKQSVLHPSSPRPCTAALLASMLWISAQHSDSSFLSSQPDLRARTCQRLLELTIDRLKPLVHNHGAASSNASGNNGSIRTDAALGGLVLPVDIMAGKEASRQQVDNIVTYIHLATVVSASERKAASLRWWNAAWSLARETRLGREINIEEMVDKDSQAQIPLKTVNSKQAHHYANSQASDSTRPSNKNFSRALSEEDREERRRAWWMLYIMDKHLAICYNRPAFFLNKECEGLLLPMDENRFQLGHFGNDVFEERRRGLDIECTSLSVYGFFLPLMVILGEILDLNHARNRPRFGPATKKAQDFSETVIEIEGQLRAFGQSLDKVWAQNQIEVGTNTTGKSSRHVAKSFTGSKLALQSKMIVAYATHIMHVFHILLTGKWDPIALLDDNDLWISSQAFVHATGHAVMAAKALADIIDYDPDLGLMPYFFGIYLLQGSFLLLLFADKLQDNITPDVVEACETIVRAHEACVSTLDTQYQRNFRRVMRSALQQFRGRMHEDVTEQQNWRREILKLYRWTGDGTGLAL